MILQAITNVRAKSHRARHNVVGWGLREGRYVAATATMEHQNATEFLAKLIDVVLPKIKEWKGAKGSSGDGHGNISLGLTPDQLALFPEIEVNYDAYVYLFLTTHRTTDSSQIPPEDDPWSAHHHLHRRHEQQGRAPAAPSNWPPILRQTKRLMHHPLYKTCNMYFECTLCFIQVRVLVLM
jgi:hypothetical protein